MNDLEQQLRTALERKDPSDEFTARVLAPRRQWWRWAVAATLILATAAAWQFRQNQEAYAGQQAALALRITAEKLNHAREAVLRAGDAQ